MAEKIYVPKASAKQTTGNYGPVLKLGFHVDTLIAFVKQHANEKGYVNFTVTERREVSQWGETHSVMLDTWQPNQRGAAPTSRSYRPPPGKVMDQSPAPATQPPEDDIPF